MMQLSEMVMIAGFGLQLFGFVASGIWIVANIKSTSTELSGTIDHHTKTLGRLEVTMKSVETKQVDHEIRMRLLERERE